MMRKPVDGAKSVELLEDAEAYLHAVLEPAPRIASVRDAPSPLALAVGSIIVDGIEPVAPPRGELTDTCPSGGSK